MTTVTITTAALAKEKVWFDKPSYDKAERQYFEKMAKVRNCFYFYCCDHPLLNK